MSREYILDAEHNPILVNKLDPEQWVKWTKQKDFLVARTLVKEGVVSTIFLGIDYSFGNGRPLLFESMSRVGNKYNFERYYTWKEAEIVHAKMVEECGGEYRLPMSQGRRVAIAEVLFVAKAIYAQTGKPSVAMDRARALAIGADIADPVTDEEILALRGAPAQHGNGNSPPDRRPFSIRPRA